MTTAKYPGYRHMTAAQRYNARHDRIWEQYRKQEAAKVKDSVVLIMEGGSTITFKPTRGENYEAMPYEYFTV